jgi:hypothetical protein
MTWQRATALASLTDARQGVHHDAPARVTHALLDVAFQSWNALLQYPRADGRIYLSKSGRNQGEGSRNGLGQPPGCPPYGLEPGLSARLNGMDPSKCQPIYPEGPRASATRRRDRSRRRGPIIDGAVRDAGALADCRPPVIARSVPPPDPTSLAPGGCHCPWLSTASWSPPGTLRWRMQMASSSSGGTKPKQCWRRQKKSKHGKWSNGSHTRARSEGGHDVGPRPSWPRCGGQDGNPIRIHMMTTSGRE